MFPSHSSGSSSILRSMKHGNDRNLMGGLVDLIHDDKRQADNDPLIGTPRAADMSHIRQLSQAIGSIMDTCDNLGCRP